MSVPDKVSAVAQKVEHAVASNRPSKGPTSVQIPHNQNGFTSSLKTPKTPADNAIEFFQSPIGDNEDPIRVYELPLDADGGPNKDRSYIRLPPPYSPYVLRVTLDAGTPASRNGVFKTNFPLDGGLFHRSKFVERKLPADPSKPIAIDLPISHAGAFVYWVEHDEDKVRVKGREGYFNIDPVLRAKDRSDILSDKLQVLPVGVGGVIKEKARPIPLDGLAILTVVSKWMGSLDKWEPYLRESAERGYNMLHFTPLQQRGESKSPYSIADQMSYDVDLFPEVSHKERQRKVAEMLELAKDKYGLMSLTDIVLNHTANNSEWLLDHPEAGFSPFNSPHLTPAVEIDDAMINFSASLASRGLPIQLHSSSDLDKIMDEFTADIRGLNLWQYYVLDVARERANIREALDSKDIPVWDGDNVARQDITTIANILRKHGKIDGIGSFSKRFCVSVAPKVAASVIRAAFVDLNDSNALADVWVKVVDVLNVDLYKEANEDMKTALENVRNRVQYTRLDSNGPQLGSITREQPLVETYFTRLPHNKKTSDHQRSALSLANNGWIWAANPLENFALQPSKAYLRREVIVWGDCVKLRYGEGPESNPWLWEHMTNYVTTLASQFDGFRIDNCHSTPLHVGIALLDAARVVNPDIYVCAELFTGSEEMDMHFVSRLGINSLIREAYNAGDPKEFSRILYRFGINKPIGSMDLDCLSSPGELAAPTGKGPSRPCTVIPLQGSVPHALLFDLTHDNESPLHKRSAQDALSTGALVAFSHCAIGSNKGFDDLYPKLLDLVNEERKYAVGASAEQGGISHMKRMLNHLHTEMMIGGYVEGHVHQENDYIVIHRVHPKTMHGYLLIAHTAFSKGTTARGWIKPIKLARTKAQYIVGASVNISSYEAPNNKDELMGLPSTLTDVPPINPIEGKDDQGFYSEVVVPDVFPPGSIMIFATYMEGIDIGLDDYLREGVEDMVAGLNLLDLNVMLYRANGEERDATDNEIGAYAVPDLGDLVYCGLEGWMHPLRHVMRYNDLGHPLPAHLRDGTWALNYIHTRLTKQTPMFPNLKAPAEWLNSRFAKIIDQAPPFLRPKYFAIVVYEAYKACRRAAIEQFSEFVSSGDTFAQNLALTSVQMHGQVASASLSPSKIVPSLAAGLPHFTAGWARTWGRDVFISLRGLFLTTGNFIAAKEHILAFCSTLKHGLIPNLLDSVRNPRYNSRDSPWWMLQNIQDYVSTAPDGISLLQESVRRRFPKDDRFVPWDDLSAYSDSSTVAEIIQEILQRHAEGISFREHNAGPNLDMQMRDEGFNIDIRVDWDTGLIYGGNAWNCGTWMDKMGESEKAGTKGLPGTPRDGAPVEITGLLKSTLRWVGELSVKGRFPFKGVKAIVGGEKRLITYREWSDLLQKSFEKCYYIPLDPADDGDYKVNPQIVNRRGIYKDVVGSGQGREWSDYQFRPNFPIAMTVAPELFDPQHALIALRLADVHLRSRLGMKTLDNADSQYRGDYDNSNDSADPSTAKGRNYHQGPEWGWPLGYFLRAFLHFELVAGEGKHDQDAVLHRLSAMLLNSREHIRSDPWAGLPELTNKDGAYCRDSCATQAWSSSTVLDFLDDVHRLKD